MALTDINSEDRLVQETFAAHLHDVLGWDSLYAWNQETFGPDGTLGRRDTTEVVLTRDLRAAIEKFNPELPPKAVEEVIERLTRQDFTRSTLQHNQAFYRYVRDGVPVSYRDDQGQMRHAYAKVIDFRRPAENAHQLAILHPFDRLLLEPGGVRCFRNFLHPSSPVGLTVYVTLGRRKTEGTSQ